MKKIEISQHARYTCTFCGKVTVKRHSTGIWDCKSCKKTVAGGAYTLSYVADLRPAIRTWRAHRPSSTLLTIAQHPGRRCHQVYHPSSARDRRGINGLWHQGGSRWSSMSAFKFAALGNSVADNEEIPSKSSNYFHMAHREAYVTRPKPRESGRLTPSPRLFISSARRTPEGRCHLLEPDGRDSLRSERACRQATDT